MTVTSMRADEIAARARRCFELGLIREETMERVLSRAYSDPEYDPILDLPLSFEIAAEEKRRADAAIAARRTRRRLWLRRLLFR